MNAVAVTAGGNAAAVGASAAIVGRNAAAAAGGNGIITSRRPLLARVEVRISIVNAAVGVVGRATGGLRLIIMSGHHHRRQQTLGLGTRIRAGSTRNRRRGAVNRNLV